MVITKHVCVLVALGNQHAMRMCHNKWPAPLYNNFVHYLMNGTVFEKKKKLLNIKCAFRVFLQGLYEIFLIIYCMKYL